MNDQLNLILEKYHAVLVESDIDFVHELKDFYGKETDTFLLKKEDINIEDASFIKENAILKPSFGPLRILIVGANKFNREAEQSLLKILEEPPATTKIIFVSPNTKLFSSTILSRVIKIKDEKNDVSKNIEKFLKLSVPERIKEVEKIIKDEDFNAISFLSDLENTINNKDLSKESLWRDALSDIWESKRAFQIAGTSKKQIFEYLAITLPKI